MRILSGICECDLGYHGVRIESRIDDIVFIFQSRAIGDRLDPERFLRNKGNDLCSRILKPLLIDDLAIPLDRDVADTEVHILFGTEVLHPHLVEEALFELVVGIDEEEEIVPRILVAIYHDARILDVDEPSHILGLALLSKVDGILISERQVSGVLHLSALLDRDRTVDSDCRLFVDNEFDTGGNSQIRTGGNSQIRTGGDSHGSFDCNVTGESQTPCVSTSNCQVLEDDISSSGSNHRSCGTGIQSSRDYYRSLENDDIFVSREDSAEGHRVVADLDCSGVRTGYRRNSRFESDDRSCDGTGYDIDLSERDIICCVHLDDVVPCLDIEIPTVDIGDA